MRVLAAAAAGLLLLGCGPPDPGSAAADELWRLNSPLVVSVRYDADNQGSGPVLGVVVTADASPKQAREFGCLFVAPVVAAHKLPDEVAWWIVDPTGNEWSNDAMPCPNAE